MKDPIQENHTLSLRTWQRAQKSSAYEIKNYKMKKNNLNDVNLKIFWV